MSSPAHRKSKIMALREFKIIFKGGATQTVEETTGPSVHGDWLTFADGGGEILRVRADDVESVSRPDVPERTKRAPPDCRGLGTGSPGQ